MEAVNARHVPSPRLVRRLARRRLRPAEVAFLERHQDALSGDVLEIGCCGGELTDRLIRAARSVTGLHRSRRVIEQCTGRHPGGVFLHGELADVEIFPDGQFDAVVACGEAIDLVGDDERRRLLDRVHRVLVPGGTLIFSSHNLGSESLVPPPARNWSTNPLKLAVRLARLPDALRHRAHLGRLQEREYDYGILNRHDHDYRLLHYHVTRDGQERQLAQHCFRLLECVTLDGAPVEPGDLAYGSHRLYYAAEAAW